MARRRRKQKAPPGEFKVVNSAIERAEEFQRITLSPHYLLQNWWTIPRPTGGPQRFTPHPYQLDLLDDLFYTEDDLLVLKARQIGFTTAMAGYMTWFALSEPGTKVIYFSQTHALATGVIQDIVNTGLAPMPDWLQRAMLGPKPEDATLKGRINFANGSVIKAGVTQKTGRSETAGLCILDEWAFYDNPPKSWAAAQPTTDEGGRAIAFSTANEENQFYEQQWADAIDGLNGFKPRFYGWDANPRRDNQWFAEIQRKMPADERCREYPTIPSEAFTRTGSQVFPADVLEKLPRPYAGVRGALFTPEREDGEKRKLPTRNEIEFIESISARQPDDRLEIWIEPDPPDVAQRRKYVIGVDTCFGTPTGDFAAAVVLRDDGALCAVYHARVKEHDLADTIAALGMYYHRALVLVETAGAGSGRHCAHLLDKEYRYPRLYRQPRTPQSWVTDFQREPGWPMTANSKAEMVARLTEKLLDPALNLVCAKTQRELGHYLYLKTTGDRKKMGAPKPLHDDLVIALGIAVWGLQWSKTQPEAEFAEEAPELSAPWFIAQSKQRGEERGYVEAMLEQQSGKTMSYIEAKLASRNA